MFCLEALPLIIGMSMLFDICLACSIKARVCMHRHLLKSNGNCTTGILKTKLHRHKDRLPRLVNDLLMYEHYTI